MFSCQIDCKKGMSSLGLLSRFSSGHQCYFLQCVYILFNLSKGILDGRSTLVVQVLLVTGDCR